MFANQLLRDIKDSIPFRTLMYPVGTHKFKKYNRDYLNSEYPDRIRSLQGKFRGKRCFVIGNGPSLKPSDLDMIAGEYSFGTNKIYNIYDKTSWRPTFYICMDSMSIAEEIADESDRIQADYCFINYQQSKRFDNEKKIYFCNANPRYVINIWGDDKVTFSTDCATMIDNARTVTYTAIQLAAYMGFEEIYLLGVDANYPFYRDKHGRKHSTDAVEAHFKNGGYNRIDYLVKETNENGYRAAKKYCDDHGITIANCTRGGKLEIFDRKELETVLG